MSGVAKRVMVHFFHGLAAAQRAAAVGRGPRPWAVGMLLRKYIPPFYGGYDTYLFLC